MSVYDKIGELILALRFRYHVEEFGDASELANYIKELESGEGVDALLSLEGRPRPYLISAYREGDDVVLALVDLDDVRSLKTGVKVEELEEVTSALGAEKYGSNGLAPFFFPIMERDGEAFFALGLKAVLPLTVVTGGAIDELLEILEVRGDEFFNAIVGALKSLY
ncbi:hypothetical protein [Thermoproteus tenax]|uniref:Uncharacterized protein n=1 Tax=Thermoproteus tenax (strain ATCC 35583 / DSM 2078 / JCM 9277 / NBRC 100435 / Kra 1) TaxID=768679 RepID=G4RNF4_THETK|nr:hypothetical protein [Thermoproteus tenax]CCC81098.1 conserved hypothetical protein [Thermoproteus tenax Kra 1]